MKPHRDGDERDDSLPILDVAVVEWLNSDLGRTALIELPYDVELSFTPWLSTIVKLDGRRYRIGAVDRPAHAPPWRAGETVGLIVQPV